MQAPRWSCLPPPPQQPGALEVPPTAAGGSARASPFSRPPSLQAALHVVFGERPNGGGCCLALGTAGWDAGKLSRRLQRASDFIGFKGCHARCLWYTATSHDTLYPEDNPALVNKHCLTQAMPM